MAKKGELVQRPAKKSEYVIRFASAQAQKGWRDLVAVAGPTSHLRRPGHPGPQPQRNVMADTYDFLTTTPTQIDPRTNYPLKGELGHVTDQSGTARIRWQHKPTATGDGRVWFYLDGSTVWLEQVHTHHPNQTK